MPCNNPKPLDPAIYGTFNAYIAPLMDHYNTHYLEILMPKSNARLLVRYRKAGYLEASENGEHWNILGSDEDLNALEALLQECEVRYVKIGEVKQEIFDRLDNLKCNKHDIKQFRRADEMADQIIDAEADSVRILADAEVLL